LPTTRRLEKARPIYLYHDGWRRPIGPAKCFEDLPERARAYVLRLEALIEVPIRWVSFGPHLDKLNPPRPGPSRFVLLPAACQHHPQMRHLG
jgi:adenylosuccinate synthase